MKLKYSTTLLTTATAILITSLPLLASQEDHSIESAAKDSYVFENYLKNDDINVESTNGAVNLTGTVSSDAHKSLAKDTVENLPGVKSVDNQLKVKGEQPAEKSDAWIITKVKTTLLFHRNVSAMTEVSSTNGIVTLQGHADNQAQKDLTAEYANDIEGVKKVNNKMVVSNTVKMAETAGRVIDDASITAQVKMTLLNHRSTSAVHTEVNTKNGLTTISGKAKNSAEKNLVTKLVNDVNGVTSVKNNMTVEKS